MASQATQLETRKQHRYAWLVAPKSSATTPSSNPTAVAKTGRGSTRYRQALAAITALPDSGLEASSRGSWSPTTSGQPLQFGQMPGKGASPTVGERNPRPRPTYLGATLVQLDVAGVFKGLEMLARHRVSNGESVTERPELDLLDLTSRPHNCRRVGS